MNDTTALPDQISKYQSPDDLPVVLWEEVAKVDAEGAMRRTAAAYDPAQGFRVPFLGHEHINRSVWQDHCRLQRTPA